MPRLHRQTVQQCAACMLITLGLLTLWACDESPPPSSLPVQKVRSREAMLDRASAIARADLERFIQALNHPDLMQSGFMFRAPLPTELGTTEDVWISAESYSDNTFTGILDDKPPSITSVDVGDTITVSRHDIVDWMYTDKDSLVGGWTLRVDIDFMQPGERRIMMDYFHLTTGDLTIPPPQTPE